MESLVKWPRVKMENISSGIVEVDLKIDDNGSEYDAVLLAGHMASEIKEDDVTRRPVLGWALSLKGTGIN